MRLQACSCCFLCFRGARRYTEASGSGTNSVVSQGDMNKFISVTSGAYTLQGRGSEVKKGTYEFDLRSGNLRDEGGSVVGKFSCDPIDDPFPQSLDAEAKEPIQCVDITNSEIIAEIQKPGNAGAYFVLPSQLNGAEYPSPSSVVDKMDAYKYDNTGGPRGQLAVHPAAGQFVLDNAAHDGKPEGINAIDAILETTGSGFQLVNGYLQMPTPGSESEATELLDAFRSQIHTLRPLVMEDVPACGLTPDKARFSGETHKVNLVYASAVPVDAYINRAESPPQRLLHGKVAEAVLVAQYYGALKLAAQRTAGRGKTKVYLMPLGGGVFNNPWESIAKGISLAVEMLLPGHRERLDIQVLTWSGNSEEKLTMCRLLSQFNKLKE